MLAFFSSLENKCVAEDLFFRVNILVMDYAGVRFSSVIVKGYAWQGHCRMFHICRDLCFNVAVQMPALISLQSRSETQVMGC